MVFAHFIVGNTYNYTINDWFKDISLASSKGIDAFALNVGADSWDRPRFVTHTLRLLNKTALHSSCSSHST
ncbi:hypothetical protein A0H81_01817 [Grifola frondosa]|uniref:Uncharacterized protein n=1 Tax=Grifola frondosa TaxID=5627 RepID=A0A1C7MK43_GRIFR|nr:hypothetical protein A0H81_01817 [Grifola frondosa]